MQVEHFLVQETVRYEVDRKIKLGACLECLNTLTERERQVVIFKVFEFLTLEETGRKFNIGRERTRQIYAKALRKLRHSSRTSILQKLGIDWIDKSIEKKKQVLKKTQTRICGDLIA